MQLFMCGIVGISSSQNSVNQDIYDALTIVQHRGQDAAGMMTSLGDKVFLRKANGLVRDVIRQRHMLYLQGQMGIGHVRYPTAGSHSPEESQPFYVNSPYGLGLVHNGNLTNVKALANTLIRSDLRHLNTHSDSEILLNVIAHELQNTGKANLTPEQLFSALARVYTRIQGGFAGIILIHDYGLVGFRDPHGIRPLVFGKRSRGGVTDYMFASETIALDALGFKVLQDVKPGQAIFVEKNGTIHERICAPTVLHAPCLFEFIYLARPDSIIDGISVYQARLGMGKKLAQKIQKIWPENDIDVVIPIPDTSRTAAHALAGALHLPYSEGFVKNRYIGRTFIMPGQKVRKNSVKLKLNPIRQEFAGKNVLLVDDSIVRGTTSKEIIQLARDAGAKKVYFASAAPEIRFPNVYGIDMPSAEELIAHNRTLEEITLTIGADYLIYQDLSDVYQAVLEAVIKPNHDIQHFEDSVFTGHYITGDINAQYLEVLAQARAEQ